MLTCELCKKQVKSITHTHLKHGCIGQITSLKEYRELFPGAETISNVIRQKVGHSAESFKHRYGEIEGVVRWDEYRAKMASKNSFESFETRHGWTHDEWDSYNKSRGITQKNLTRKYGAEEGAARWVEYCNKQRDAGNTLEYFIEKLGEIDGPKKYAEVCKSKGITLENMIRVHGRESGIAKYHGWLEKTKGNYISLSASQFVKDVIELLPHDIIFHEGIYGKEFCVWADRPYMYDLVITHPKKKVVEFNGDFWHANPASYEATEIVKHRGGGKLAKDIWEQDAKKLAAIKNRGFDVLIIWESDYMKKPELVTGEVAKWIMN